MMTFSAEVGEDLRAPRPGKDATEVENADVGEGAGHGEESADRQDAKTRQASYNHGDTENTEEGEQKTITGVLSVFSVFSVVQDLT